MYNYFALLLMHFSFQNKSFTDILNLKIVLFPKKNLKVRGTLSF